MVAVFRDTHDYAYAGPCPSAVVITKLTNLAHRNYVMVLLLCTVRHSDFAYVFLFYVRLSHLINITYIHTYIKIGKTSADYDATATQRVAIC